MIPLVSGLLILFSHAALAQPRELCGAPTDGAVGVRPPSGCPCPAPAPVSPSPGTPSDLPTRSRSQVSPVVVATLGLTAGGEIGGVVLDGDGPAAAIVGLDVGSVFSTGLEWSNGGRLWFGPGLTIASLPDPFSFDKSDRTVTSFDLRGRATIDIAGAWGVDFGVICGVSRWADDGIGALWGWTYRFVGGPSYELQPGLTLIAELAFWRADIGNRAGLFSDQFTSSQPLAAAAWVLSVGARLW